MSAASWETSTTSVTKHNIGHATRHSQNTSWSTGHDVSYKAGHRPQKTFTTEYASTVEHDASHRTVWSARKLDVSRRTRHEAQGMTSITKQDIGHKRHLPQNTASTVEHDASRRTVWSVRELDVSHRIWHRLQNTSSTTQYNIDQRVRKQPRNRTSATEHYISHGTLH